jgi:hypothetical protein
MRRSNVGQADFERFISDLTPLQGKKFKGPDQAAMQARERIEHRDRQAFAPGGEWTPPTEAEVKQREKDWHAVRAMDRRKTRGGQTYHKGDLISE